MPAIEKSVMDYLIKAAMWAPSGDDVQPWKFAVNAKEGWIRVELDPARDPSVWNTGQVMSRIACGAAVENLTAAARERGMEGISDISEGDAVTVKFSLRNGSRSSAPSVWASRVTNRRVYDGRALPADVLSALQAATPARDGVSTHWISERNSLRALAGLISRADRMLFGVPSARRALEGNIDFAAGAKDIVEAKLPAVSLEIPAPLRWSLRMMLKLPNAVFKPVGGGLFFGIHAWRMVRSSSGVCVIASSDKSEAGAFRAGRALEKAWLALTEQGLAVQPMMTMPVANMIVDHGAPELISQLGRENVAVLQMAFRNAIPELKNDRIAAILRFGYAPPPSTRTGRLPREKLVRDAV